MECRIIKSGLMFLINLAQRIRRVARLSCLVMVGRWLLANRVDWQEPRRILLVRPFGVGDYLMATPAIAAIRERFPEAHIDLGVSRSVTADVAALSDAVDEVRTFADIATNQPSAFDLAVVLFPRSWDGVRLLRRIRPRMIVGYVFDHRVRSNWVSSISEGRERANHLENNLLVSDALRAARVADHPQLGPIRCEEVSVGRFASPRPAPVIVINPGTRDPYRSWPHEHWAELLLRIKSWQPEARVIAIGGPDDRQVAGRLLENAALPRAFNAAGRTTWAELACLLREADVFVTTDSGPMHVGISQHSTTVALFGPTRPDNLILNPQSNLSMLWHDIGRNPCYFGTRDYSCDCHKGPCCEALARVTPSEVFERVRRMVELQRATSSGGSGA